VTPPTTTETTRLSARIPTNLDRALRVQAGRERVTRTQLVVRLLRDGLRRCAHDEVESE